MRARFWLLTQTKLNTVIHSPFNKIGTLFLFLESILDTTDRKCCVNAIMNASKADWADSELLSFLKQAQSRSLFISIFCFSLTRRETGKVSLLLWCGSCSFGTPLYVHFFSLNHSCKQVRSAFFSYRFWIEFKAPGSSSLLHWFTFKVVQHNSVDLRRSKPACDFHALSMIFWTTCIFQDSKI